MRAGRAGGAAGRRSGGEPTGQHDGQHGDRGGQARLVRPGPFLLNHVSPFPGVARQRTVHQYHAPDATKGWTEESA